MVLIRTFGIALILYVCLTSTAPLERRFLGTRHLLDAVKGKLFSGSGTFYKVGSGSCGEYDSNSDLVVAVNKAQMHNGKNPNDNPLCDQMVSITGDHGSTSARVVDTCSSCKSGALDMSPLVFKKVCGSLAEGVCTVNWHYL